jgi:hypothetical protein
VAHEKAVKKFRESLIDPELQRRLEEDLRSEELMKKRYEERNKPKRD